MQKPQRGQQPANTPAIPQTTNQGTDADFQLERYKYILEEIRSLNESIHKYLTLFQTLAVTIIGGGISIFVVWKNLRIDANIARTAIQGVIGLLILLALFVTASIVASMFSWFDYRQEEVELLNKAVGPGYRKPPTFRNFWRWPETYILLFINVSVIVVSLYVEYQVIPLVK